MENGGRQISSVTLYACGTCKNNIASVLKGEKKKEIVFPALVARLEHKSLGTVLFDTGYSKRIYGNGIVSKIYNLLNPSEVKEEDTISYKMKTEGRKVSFIILSHPHPDHIGCLKDFDDYTLLATEDCINGLKRAKNTELVFRNQVPDMTGRIKIQSLVPLAQDDGVLGILLKHFTEAYDIFGDGSVYGVRLDGHTIGQMGIYIPEFKLLLAADSSWGHYFAERVDKMKFMPKKIQKDYAAYKNTVERVKAFEKDNPDIRVIYSHEEFPEGVYEQ